MNKNLIPILATALSLSWLLPASPANAADRSEAVSTISTDVSEQLNKSVKTRLMEKLGFDGLLVMVSVSGEAATLTGEVAKSFSRRLAERVALTVKGIRKVDNQLTVGPEDKYCRGTVNPGSR